MTLLKQCALDTLATDNIRTPEYSALDDSLALSNRPWPEADKGASEQARLFGSIPEDYDLRAFRDVHPEDRHMVLGRIEQALANGNNQEDYEVEYRIVHPSGVRWLSARGTVSRDNTGRALRMAGVCTDITARKEAEEGVRSEQRRLATLVEASPVGVIIWHPATDRILLANPEASRITRTDLTPGDRMGEALEELAFQGEEGALLAPEQLPAFRLQRVGIEREQHAAADSDAAVV